MSVSIAMKLRDNGWIWDIGHEPHEACWSNGADEASCPLSPVPLIIRYYHNNHPGTGGRLAWDGTCWDQWNIIGQVEQLFIHSLAHPATSFKGRFSASSASHYELNKLSLVLSYFYCLWWSVVLRVFKYRSWHQTFPADMKKVMVWWSTLSCYVFSLITDHLPCGSRSAPPRHAARARERGRGRHYYRASAASWSGLVPSNIIIIVYINRLSASFIKITNAARTLHSTIMEAIISPP